MLYHRKFWKWCRHCCTKWQTFVLNFCWHQWGRDVDGSVSRRIFQTSQSRLGEMWERLRLVSDWKWNVSVLSRTSTSRLHPCNEDDLECSIHLACLADGTLDICMLWLSELSWQCMPEWTWALNISDKKCGQWTVVSEQKRFVPIFAGFTEYAEPEWSS